MTLTRLLILLLAGCVVSLLVAFWPVDDPIVDVPRPAVEGGTP
jgi:hypothetical protein